MFSCWHPPVFIGPVYPPTPSSFNKSAHTFLSAADSSRHACVCARIPVVTEIPRGWFTFSRKDYRFKERCITPGTPRERDGSHQPLQRPPHALYSNDIIDRKLSVAVGNSCKDLQNNVLMENTRIHDGYLIRGIILVRRPLF